MVRQEGASFQVYRFITDHLGSVRLVVRVSDGQIVQRTDYDEFGGIVRTSGDQRMHPFGFAGGLHDRDTGLVRFGAREYDPWTGRWMSRDPILFAGGLANLYDYVGGDPVNWVDPAGRSKVRVVETLVRGLRIGAEVTFDEAVDLVRRGYDVLAGSRKQAKEIATAVDPMGRRPVGPERHPGKGNGRAGVKDPDARSHFHSFGRPDGWGHIFYNFVFSVCDQVPDGRLDMHDVFEMANPWPTPLIYPDTGPEA
jgi:RHS repeat-associated protein